MASGECDRLTLKIPEDYQVIELSCTNLEQWILSQGPGYQTIILRLADSSQRRLTLKLLAEKLFNKEQSQRFPEIIPIEANREKGIAELSYQDPYKVSITESTSVRKVKSYLQAKSFFEVFRYNDHPYTLSFSIAEQTYKNFVQSHMEVAVEDEKVTLLYQTTLKVKEKRMFYHRLALPEQFTVREVTGEMLRYWRINGDTLEMVFKRSLFRDDDATFDILLDTKFEPGRPFELPMLKSENVEYESGNVLVLSPRDLDLKVQDVKGLQEYDISAFSVRRKGLVKRYAYRYEGIDYNAKIMSSLKQSEISAQAVVNLLVEDDWLNFGYFIDFKIQYAGADTFHFRFPIELGTKLDILGENIREKRFTKRKRYIDWTVILHNKVRGSYRLSVFPDIIKNTGAGVDFYPVYFPPDVQSKSCILVQNKSQYELNEQKMEGIKRISLKQALFFPPLTESHDFIRAYRVNADQWQLSLSENKQKVIRTTHAAVDNIKVDTVIQESGECRHRVIYNLRHSGLQFLELDKIPDTKIWGAFVGGRFVRPLKNRSADKILIPLAQQGQKKEQKISVRIIYEQKFESIERSGYFKFQLPGINIEEVSKVIWTLHTTPEYIYRFGGNVDPSGGYESFNEYNVSSRPIIAGPVSYKLNEDNLKSALANSNSLKDRQNKWLQQKQSEQQELFAKVQDVRQQANSSLNFDNLKKVEQFGLRNLMDAQRASQGQRQIYQDKKSDRIVGETNKGFITRQNQLAQQKMKTKQQILHKQQEIPFYFDIHIPSGLRSINFTGNKGNALLEVTCYQDPHNSIFWITLQFLSLLGLIILSHYWRIFSDKYTLQKFLLTCVLLVAAICLFNFLDFVHNFYL